MSGGGFKFARRIIINCYQVRWGASEWDGKLGLRQWINEILRLMSTIWKGVLNSRTAEEPSPDSRGWHSLTSWFDVILGSESVDMSRTCCSDGKRFRDSEGRLWQLVRSTKSSEGRVEFWVFMQNKVNEMARYRIGGTCGHWFCPRPCYNIVLKLLCYGDLLHRHGGSTISVDTFSVCLVEASFKLTFILYSPSLAKLVLI